MNKRLIGKKYENFAVKYLENKGYRIIEQNYTIKGGEIDIISFKDNTYIFFEVKSLKETSGYSIFESVTKRKKRFLKNAIQSWLLSNNLENSSWKAEFLGIVVEKTGLLQVLHFEFLDLN